MAARTRKVSGKGLDGKKVIQRAQAFAEEVQQSARRLAADVADTTGARMDKMTARAQEVAQELEAATGRVTEEVTSAMERARDILRRAAADARKRAGGNGFHAPAARKPARKTAKKTGKKTGKKTARKAAPGTARKAGRKKAAKKTAGKATTRKAGAGTRKKAAKKTPRTTGTTPRRRAPMPPAPPAL